MKENSYIRKGNFNTVKINCIINTRKSENSHRVASWVTGHRCKLFIYLIYIFSYCSQTTPKNIIYIYYVFK